jgi:Na+/citrate or Na+/malate symporter
MTCVSEFCMKRCRLYRLCARGIWQVLVPLMLAVFFAKLVGDALGLSVYDTHIKIKGAPVLASCHSTLYIKSIVAMHLSHHN